MLREGCRTVKNHPLLFGMVLSCATVTFASTGVLPSKQANTNADESTPAPPELIMGRGRISQGELVSFFLENNPDADEARVARLAALYIEESAVEGVNSDVAFIQMCLETGFLRFGGLVAEEQNNFCGLGATGPGEPGLFFPDERTGVRAHIQHLKGYGSTDPLVGGQVDPRYPYITPKGKSPSIAGLAGTWAADPQYGVKLTDLLASLYE
jgi:hypothetical protein